MVIGKVSFFVWFLTALLPLAARSSCLPATEKQITLVDEGAAKISQFLEACALETDDSPLCEQIIQSNPKSRYIYHCTYDRQGPYIFIHPDETTWENAFATIEILTTLINRGVNLDRIYNWWRPEPYNQNVGGEAGRHPFGTAIDVRFATVKDQNLAYGYLCHLQRQGAVNAIGYYTGSPSIHIGISDNLFLQRLWGPTKKQRGCQTEAVEAP